MSSKRKTNKSLASRVKLTAHGKLKRGHPGKRHLLTKKSSSRKRHLSRPALVSAGLTKTYKRMLCVT